MTSDFNNRKDSGQRCPANAQVSKEMDILQRDRFELLSAYLDSEVTADERKQVQEWLKSDPKMQCLYTRLVKLRQGLQTLPVPESEQSAQQAVNQVFGRINRRRSQRVAAWGGAAIAALFVGALSGILPGNHSLTPQLAKAPIPETAAEPLMVALNHPAVEIPKAAVAAPEKFVKPSVDGSDAKEYQN